MLTVETKIRLYFGRAAPVNELVRSEPFQVISKFPLRFEVQGRDWSLTCWFR